MKTLHTIFVVLGVALAATIPGAAVANGSAVSLSSRSGVLGEVKFRFDSAVLPAETSRALGDVAAFASAHPEQRIVLDAHCDPIGTAAYNVGLAIRRAEAVRQQLMASGVSDDQIVFAIYGKDGEHRARYADDRRVTLWPTREPLAAVIDRTLAGRGTAVTWQRPLSTAQIEAAPEPVASR